MNGVMSRRMAGTTSSELGASKDAVNSSGTGLSICYVTVPDEELANKLASKLVETKLAACVNIIPGIKSTYFWEGKVAQDSELLLMIKTRNSLREDLISFVKENHSYTLPEVICTDIVAGSPAYLKWVMDSTKHDL
jgi:uncharacterized protein involved in tolerance to divalent cations